MKLCVLGSGSKGHSVYVTAGGTRVLFDAGFSTLQIKKRLRSIGVDIADLDAVVISHEHTDHIAGLRVMGRRFPVYATGGTIANLRGRFELDRVETIEAGTACEIGDLTFMPVPVSHDASEPVGFVIEDGSSRAAIVTDLGSVTRAVVHRLEDLDLAVIESNHDARMLMEGPYPWELKQRIKSRHGHLSNHQAANLIGKIIHPRLKRVLLAHLSETNNRPEAARGEAESALNGSSCLIEVCCQDCPTRVIKVG